MFVGVAAENGIGDTGAAALGEALKMNSTVTTLDLGGKCCVSVCCVCVFVIVCVCCVD